MGAHPGLSRVLATQLAVLAAAQFGTIRIDWRGSPDGGQVPVVAGGADLMTLELMEVEEQPREAVKTKEVAKLLAERALVAVLAEEVSGSPNAIAALWDHWFGEEGEDARASIEDAAGSLQDPDAAGEAPSLLALTIRFPGWAEPVNRLATLRFLQRRFAESAELCERVLALKPWHFGALHGIVMCHTELGDHKAAMRWAENVLPELGTAERNVWVVEMLGVLDSRIAAVAAESEDR